MKKTVVQTTMLSVAGGMLLRRAWIAVAGSEVGKIIHVAALCFSFLRQ